VDAELQFAKQTSDSDYNSGDAAGDGGASLTTSPRHAVALVSEPDLEGRKPRGEGDLTQELKEELKEEREKLKRERKDKEASSRRRRRTSQIPL
jgi:hypothetical protein